MAMDVGNVASYQSTTSTKPASNVGTVSVENTKGGNAVSTSQQSSTTDQPVAVGKVAETGAETKINTTEEYLKKKDNQDTTSSNIATNSTQQVTKETSLKDVSEFGKIVNNNTVAEFSYNEPTKRIAIKIKDKETNEVIREIPSEKALEMLAKAWELAGIMVDEKR